MSALPSQTGIMVCGYSCCLLRHTDVDTGHSKNALRTTQRREMVGLFLQKDRVIEDAIGQTLAAIQAKILKAKEQRPDRALGGSRLYWLHCLRAQQGQALYRAL